jgi:histidinol-phosphate/aromatic aminotransferase/cobyric acid decarboxylase-like protein
MAVDGPVFVRSDVRCLSGYAPGEQPRDRIYVKLNTNESPYPPSPRVLQALRAATTGALRLYPDPLATSLRERAAEAYELLLARLPGREDTVRRLCKGLRDHGVLVRYFELPALRDAVRITVGTPDEAGALLRAMDEALDD